MSQKTQQTSAVQSQCAVCHSRQPKEGLSVCEVCMGLKNEDSSDTQTSVCSVCGIEFVPYRMGNNTIYSLCQDCFAERRNRSHRKLGQEKEPSLRITIEFTKPYHSIYKRIIEDAIEQLRTPDRQALWMLMQYLKMQKEDPHHG